VAQPANVALVAVVDKSGSMQGSKMELVRGTVDFLAEQLSKEDALGLITYNHKVRCAATETGSGAAVGFAGRICCSMYQAPRPRQCS
jgi:hypothetical protein